MNTNMQIKQDNKKGEIDLHQRLLSNQILIQSAAKIVKMES